MTQLRVRARAVDMLGRQQIAGIPTAIHELIKSAHDTYVVRDEVHRYQYPQVPVLRDFVAVWIKPSALHGSFI